MSLRDSTKPTVCHNKFPSSSPVPTLEEQFALACFSQVGRALPSSGPTGPFADLGVRQVNPCVLEHLSRFLHEDGLQGWTLHHWRSASALVCERLPNIKLTLELLLANGLLVKRKQAELALRLSAENRLKNRDAISSLKGLQGRYQRLDTDNIPRAKEIARLQTRLQQLNGPEHATLFSQIEELRAEHSMLKLISRCDLLRKDIRQSLREGGEVVSSTTCVL